MEWTLAGTLRCDALVSVGELVTVGQVDVSLPEGNRHEFIRCLRLEKPRTVQGKRSTVGSEFDVEVQFEAGDPRQAYDRGAWCAQEVTAALAFLASVPTEIQTVRITSAHASVTGTEYTMLCHPTDEKSEILTTVPAQHAAFLILPKPERVRRALRWIQKSHLADNALDEFTCLMVAFESLSQLLKGGGTRYWHCSKCGRDVTQCPGCGEGTGSKMSGEDAMREFVVQTLGWQQKDWATTWRWRCKLLHGETDISADEEHVVAPLLPKLERAVITATKNLAGLPADHSPTHGRYRSPFAEAVLELGLRVG